MRCDQVEQSLLFAFRPLPVASLRGHTRLPHEPPTGAPGISRHSGDPGDQRLQICLSARPVLLGEFGRSAVQISPHQLSRRPRPAKGTTAGCLIQFPHVPQRLEAEPHIPSYLYMAAKPEGVSLGMDLCIECSNDHSGIQRFSSTSIRESWDSAVSNMAVGLGLDFAGRAEWIRKRNCSTYLTGSCTKTFPILSASLVQDAKPC